MPFNSAPVPTAFRATIHNNGPTADTFNLTFANQFQSTTADFRTKAGNGLQAGLPDATNAPLDISQTTRSGTTPTIGAWEHSAGVAATSEASRQNLPPCILAL